MQAAIADCAQLHCARERTVRRDDPAEHFAIVRLVGQVLCVDHGRERLEPPRINVDVRHATDACAHGKGEVSFAHSRAPHAPKNMPRGMLLTIPSVTAAG